jgi:hypothetical protein
VWSRIGAIACVAVSALGLAGCVSFSSSPFVDYSGPEEDVVQACALMASRTTSTQPSSYIELTDITVDRQSQNIAVVSGLTIETFGNYNSREETYDWECTVRLTADGRELTAVLDRLELRPRNP